MPCMKIAIPINAPLCFLITLFKYLFSPESKEGSPKTPASAYSCGSKILYIAYTKVFIL